MIKNIKLVFFCLLIFVFIFFLLFSNDDSNQKEIESKEFPDHTKKELGFEAEYPAPMKQLQQVLTHSYVKEPSDELLEIKVDLEKLNYQSNGQSNDSEIKKLQLEINELRERVVKD